MTKREAKVYYIRKSDEPDILIFDAGYNKGDIHIYEKKETKKASELEVILEQYGYNKSSGREWKLDFPK